MPAETPESASTLVFSIVDDAMDQESVELVERCRLVWRAAEQLLGVETVLGMVSAAELIRMRSVRPLIYLMGDGFVACRVSPQLTLPFDGLSDHERLEQEWWEFFREELDELCRVPVFVRSVLISLVHPDADLGIEARYDVLVLLRQRYHMQIPSWLWTDQLDRYGWVEEDDGFRRSLMC